MIEPYKLITVNIVLCLVLLIGVLLYRYVYPKKKINLLFLLVLISLLPLVSMLRTGTYQSGDLSLHAIRTMSFYKILFLEHIIPFWTPEFYSGYGDPYFGFAYFLPYFVGSVFHFLGFSFLASLKLLMAVSFILSGVFMYIFVKEDLDEKAAFAAGIFYLFAPVHLINMHFQAAIAQNLSYVFLPLSLFLTKKLVLNFKVKWLLLLSFVVSLIILSHQVTATIFIPVIFLYALFLTYTHKKSLIVLKNTLASVTFGFLLSAFYWLPVVMEARLTAESYLTPTIIFSSLPEVIFSPWRYGILFQGPKGELSFIIGYTQIIIVLFSVYFLFKSNTAKNIKSKLFFFLLLFTFFFLLLFQVSKPLYEILPFFKYFQFSWRMLIPMSFVNSLLAAIVIKRTNKPWFTTIICLITILYTILNWGNRTTIPSINDNVLREEFAKWPALSKTVGLDPTAPKWVTSNKNIYILPRKYDLEIISGKTEIKETFRDSTHHNYLIDVKSNYTTLKENTFYFPGWEVFIDNKKINIDYEKKGSVGIITFEAKKGKHKIEAVYNLSPARKIGIIISISSLGFLILYLILRQVIYPKRSRYFRHLS